MEQINKEKGALKMKEESFSQLQRALYVAPIFVCNFYYRTSRCPVKQILTFDMALSHQWWVVFYPPLIAIGELASHTSAGFQGTLLKTHHLCDNHLLFRGSLIHFELVRLWLCLVLPNYLTYFLYVIPCFCAKQG
jgi:hypothetical protein